MTNEENVRVLYAKTEKCKVGDIELEFHQLRIDDLGLLNMDPKDTDDEKANKLIKAIARTLQLPEETIRKFSIEHLVDIQEHMSRINNLSNEKIDKIKEVQERVRKQQNG